MEKEIKQAIRLYPVYEALTGDLLFYSVIETLFLTLVKGFSDAQIALLFLISDIADLALEYPTYRLIRRIGNSKSVILGALMPLISILIITFGGNLPIVIIGNIFFVASGNFQSMACAAARNNLSIIGDAENFASLFLRSNIIYSVSSTAAALICPFLFTFNEYLPAVICIIVYIGFAVLSFKVRDYSENAPLSTSEKRKMTRVNPAPAMKYLVALFCMFFCTAGVFRSNSQLLISRDLLALYSEHKGILLFGALKWISKITRLGTNVVLKKIIDRLHDSIIVLCTSLLFLALTLTALSALVLRGTVSEILICSVVYVVIEGVIWDPFRTFLRMLAVDTNSKKKQQHMLVMLNVGQSVLSVGMRFIVFITVKSSSLEYVFVVFALITVAEFILGIKLTHLLKIDRAEIINIEGLLIADEIDVISAAVEQQLTDSGFEKKQAIAWRLIVENRLLESLSDHEGAAIQVRLSIEYGEIKAKLSIDEETVDVLAAPGEDDLSQLFYGRVIRILNLD